MLTNLSALSKFFAECRSKNFVSSRNAHSSCEKQRFKMPNVFVRICRRSSQMLRSYNDRGRSASFRRSVAIVVGRAASFSAGKVPELCQNRPSQRSVSWLRLQTHMSQSAKQVLVFSSGLFHLHSRWVRPFGRWVFVPNSPSAVGKGSQSRRRIRSYVCRKRLTDETG